MRRIGTVSTQAHAERLTAYLITQGIATQADADQDRWSIWVRDEDHLDQAREIFQQFTEMPDDPRYDGAVKEANAILREEVKRQEKVRKNVVNMGQRWKRGVRRKSPLVTTVILLCIGVFFLSGFGFNAETAATRALAFVNPIHQIDAEWNPERTADRLADVRQGQVWRVITPIFLHGDLIHLAFNMLWFYMFASQIEDRRGTWRLGVIILAVALFSNLAQGLAPSDWGTFSGGPFFLGMSGVVYGLFGYVWMKTLYEPDAGMYVSAGTVAILMIFMFLGFAGVLDTMFRSGIAHLAHGVGLLAGLVIGYLPQLRGR